MSDAQSDIVELFSILLPYCQDWYKETSNKHEETLFIPILKQILSGQHISEERKLEQSIVNFQFAAIAIGLINQQSFLSVGEHPNLFALVNSYKLHEKKFNSLMQEILTHKTFFIIMRELNNNSEVPSFIRQICLILDTISKSLFWGSTYKLKNPAWGGIGYNFKIKPLNIIKYYIKKMIHPELLSPTQPVDEYWESPSEIIQTAHYLNWLLLIGVTVNAQKTTPFLGKEIGLFWEDEFKSRVPELTKIIGEKYPTSLLLFLMNELKFTLISDNALGYNFIPIIDNIQKNPTLKQRIIVSDYECDDLFGPVNYPPIYRKPFF